MNRICLAVVLLNGGIGLAQAEQPVEAPVFDHVGIQVVDLVRTVDFYTTVLGLKEVSAPFPKSEARWISLGSGHMLHIVAHGKVASHHNKWDHFALACVDLNAMITRLNGRHIPWTDMAGHHALQTRPDGVEQIFLRDPDGYTIELNDASKPAAPQ